MRIFLDANVFFSAAFSNGAIRRLIHDIRGAAYVVVADRYDIEVNRWKLYTQSSLPWRSYPPVTNCPGLLVIPDYRKRTYLCWPPLLRPGARSL